MAKEKKHTETRKEPFIIGSECTCTTPVINYDRISKVYYCGACYKTIDEEDLE